MNHTKTFGPLLKETNFGNHLKIGAAGEGLQDDPGYRKTLQVYLPEIWGPVEQTGQLLGSDVTQTEVYVLELQLLGEPGN